MAEKKFFKKNKTLIIKVNILSINHFFVIFTLKKRGKSC